MHYVLLITISFIIGLAVGVEYHQPIREYVAPLELFTSHEEMQQSNTTKTAKNIPSVNQSNHCPDPKIVYDNRNTLSSWKANGHEWSLGSAVPGMSADVGFMQVIFYKSNHNVVCYYQFPNPEKPTQNSWAIVRFNPSSEKAPEPKGKHWDVKEDIARCNSGLKACVFEFK